MVVKIVVVLIFDVVFPHHDNSGIDSAKIRCSHSKNRTLTADSLHLVIEVYHQTAIEYHRPLG